MELIYLAVGFIAYIAIGYISFWKLWLMFRGVMWVKNVLLVKYPSGIKMYMVYVVFGLPTLYAILFDIAWNIFYGTTYFEQPPHYKRLTASARMAHIIYFEDHDSTRWIRAKHICDEYLEPYDEGHCVYNIWAHK